MPEKTTTTTLESILSPQELAAFKAAQVTWGQGTKNSLKALESMAQIGQALNTLYAKGDAKGLKREAITSMVKRAFVGLDRRERSDYKALATNFVEVKCFIEFSGIRSLNPTYLLNSWRTAVKEDRAAIDAVELQKNGGFDAQGKVMSAKESVGVMSAPTNLAKIISEAPVKAGLIVRPEPLTPKEVVEQVGCVINKMKILFNEGKFNADNLATIERHLTSGLQHINNVDEGLLTAIM